MSKEIEDILSNSLRFYALKQKEEFEKAFHREFGRVMASADSIDGECKRVEEVPLLKAPE